MPLQPEKLLKKRQQLVERTSTALATTPDQAIKLLSIDRKQSVRINSLKITIEGGKKKLDKLGVSYRPVSWALGGVSIENGLTKLRDSQSTERGELYIQNAASWLPVIALDPQPNETILDMCAAPGGKTSHIAQLANNQAHITANDNSRPRLHKLQNNLERLGVMNVNFTLHDASRLTRHMEAASYDKILLDAPCSGEGMMTLGSNKDFESWSVAHIKRLQQLQKKLIVQAWELLKPGGRLVYSTCTMAPEENEAVIDYLLRHNNDCIVEDITHLGRHLANTVRPVSEWNNKPFDSRIQNALRLMPSSEVEAFFVITLTKTTAPTIQGYFEA